MKLSEVIEAFLADLLLATANRDADGLCYRSMKRETFTGQRVSFRPFEQVVQAFKELDLAQHIRGRGHVRRNPFDEDGTLTYYAGKGIASRFRATQGLLDMAAGEDIILEDVRSHFKELLPVEPLQLKSSAVRVGGTKQDGELKTIRWGPKSLALKAQIVSLNAFLAEFNIQGGHHAGYRRIFNDGDSRTFNWNKGGRLYGATGSYQYLAPSTRLQMTIGGSRVVEIDISASYLTMLYGLLGEHSFDPHVRDPYAVDGVERSVAKAWTAVTFSNDVGHFTRWPASMMKAFLKSDGRNLPDVMSTSKVRTAMVARHPILARWGTLGITWADLMFHESQAVLGAMQELMAAGIPSLSVHDSLIVREEDREVSLETLGRHYHAVSGITPRMKVNTPEPAH